MDKALSRLLTACALVVSLGVLSVAACTHSSEQRVVEPIGGQDASTTAPEVGDAGVNPIGPIAHPTEPDEDFRLVRAPEFGASREVQLVQSGSGGSGPGNGGFGGSDLRPVVACGGGYH